MNVVRISVGRLVGFVGRVEELCAIALLFGLAATVMLQVLGRYILTNPFIWTEEVTRLMLIWMTFIASAAVTRRGIHIGVDMVVELAPPRLKRALKIIVDLIVGITFAWLTLLALGLADMLRTLPLAATRWPMSWVVWPATVGCALISFYGIGRALLRLADATGIAKFDLDQSDLDLRT